MHFSDTCRQKTKNMGIINFIKQFMKEKRNINERVEAELESLEVKDEEKAKGTRDLFLETLTKIGCQYEIDSEDGNIPLCGHCQ